MIRLTFDGAGAPAELGPRVIAGQAVPWDTPGRPAGWDGPVIFRPASVDVPSIGASRLLLDHDRARPIGRPIAARDTGRDGLWVSWLVARTRDGDDAMALVGDGVRDGLSVGANVTGYETTPAGELIVLAATLTETSLLTFPAYPTARAAVLTDSPRKASR